MNKLSSEGFFKLESTDLYNLRKKFVAEKINDTETLRIIKDFFLNYGFILDPHTATAVGASFKIKNKFKTIVLGTAHPYKFLDTIKLAIGKNMEAPTTLLNLSSKIEKFEVVDNDLKNIKNYILKNNDKN